MSPGVTLLETPGHTPQDVTTMVDTADGPVAFTHLWWMADGPADDQRYRRCQPRLGAF